MMKPQSIHQAVIAGDILEVEHMVLNGASINELDNIDKFTPLHTACNEGALEVCHWLLWHDADTTVATPSRGWRPLHIAAIRGQDACIQALIHNGVEVNVADVHGSSPLHLAAIHGHVLAAHSLLRAGADVLKVDVNGWTASHCASYHGRLGCLQLLYKWGGRLDDIDHAGNTPAHLAGQEGQLSCLKFLVNAAVGGGGGGQGGRSGSGSAAACLLATHNDHGETVRDLAQQFYKYDILQYMDDVDSNQDSIPAETQDSENEAFPAHLAAYNGDLSQVRQLLENGIVHLNERDHTGSTLVHKACGQGHGHVLQWLLEMGANVNIENNAHETAADLARRFAHLACLKMLHVEQDDVDDSVRTFGDDESKLDSSSSNEPAANLHSAEARKQARGRAKKRVDELERLLTIARKNFIQLGGQFAEDLKNQQEILEKQHTITELDAQLDYERLKREKLEAQIDRYRNEASHLKSRMENLVLDNEAVSTAHASVKMKKAKHRAAAVSLGDGGVFIRRNFTVPLKQGKR